MHDKLHSHYVSSMYKWYSVPVTGMPNIWHIVFRCWIDVHDWSLVFCGEKVQYASCRQQQIEIGRFSYVLFPSTFLLPSSFPTLLTATKIYHLCILWSLLCQPALICVFVVCLFGHVMWLMLMLISTQDFPTCISSINHHHPLSLLPSYTVYHSPTTFVSLYIASSLHPGTTLLSMVEARLVPSADITSCSLLLLLLLVEARVAFTAVCHNTWHFLLSMFGWRGPDLQTFSMLACSTLSLLMSGKNGLESIIKFFESLLYLAFLPPMLWGRDPNQQTFSMFAWFCSFPTHGWQRLLKDTCLYYLLIGIPFSLLSTSILLSASKLSCHALCKKSRIFLFVILLPLSYTFDLSIISFFLSFLWFSYNVLLMSLL